MKSLTNIGIVATACSIAMIAATTNNAFALVTPHPDDNTGPIAPDGSNWGAAVQQEASEGSFGGHASSQDTPRSGLGNLAQLFGSWCGLLDFLHQFDPDSYVCS